MKSTEFLRVLVPVALILILAMPAQAGPPLLCWPFDIGGAQSLPFGRQGWNAPDPKYDTSRLVDDTLALLGPQTPILVRMETLRRAAIYAGKDPRAAEELVARLMERARAAEAKGAPNATAWFDAGYLLATYRQLGAVTKQNVVARQENGYALVQRALKLRGNDAEMEFAAALMVYDHRTHAGREHLQRALASASEGSLLERNLVSHAPIFGMRGSSVSEVRASLDLRND